MASADMEIPVVRDITQKELDHFRDHGWVFVKGYVNRDVVDRLLDRGKARMCPTKGELFTADKVATVMNWWWEVTNMALQDELFARVGLSAGMGRNIQRLFGRDVGIQFLADAVMAKAPADRADGSSPTGWHQDIPSFRSIARERWPAGWRLTILPLTWARCISWMEAIMGDFMVAIPPRQVQLQYLKPFRSWSATRRCRHLHLSLAMRPFITAKRCTAPQLI
jgi:hypothetical protein